VILWDAASGRRLRTLGGHHSWVLSLAFAPDGKTLAAGTSEYTIVLWDVESGRRLHSLKTAFKDVMHLAFGGGGRVLVAASTDGRVTAWDTDTWLRIREFDTIRARSLAFSPDGALMAMGGLRQILLLDLVSGDRFAWLASPSGLYTSLAFTPDGAALAAGLSDGTLAVWQIDEVIDGD
jgi:WD40 repeat protein